MFSQHMKNLICAFHSTCFILEQTLRQGTLAKQFQIDNVMFDMESNLERKSCFVVAPVGMSVGLLLTELRKQQIEPFFISDLLKSGEFSVSQAKTIFKSVDLVIAYLISGHSLSNVFFELGVAVGAGRPVLIFVEQGVSLPTDMGGMTILSFVPENVQQQITEIVRFLEPRTSSTSEGNFESERLAYSVPRKLKSSDFHTHLERFHRAWNLGGKKTLPESALLELMSKVGWQVVEARPEIRSQSPDLAVWIDEIQKDIGNPIVFELKSSLHSVELRSAVSQLSKYITSGGAKAGVVLYNGPKLDLFKNVAQNVPPIFAFNLEEFTDLLEKRKFAAALKSSGVAARRMNS